MYEENFKIFLQIYGLLTRYISPSCCTEEKSMFVVYDTTQRWFKTFAGFLDTQTLKKLLYKHLKAISSYDENFHPPTELRF